MTTALLIMLTAQILIGGLDNLMHHELTEKLPSRASAKLELALHGVRELIYGVLFLAIAWATPHGAWAWAMLALLVTEAIVTMADFIEEDRTRTLPPFERVLHTVLALNFGAILALGAPAWSAWAAAPTALALTEHGYFSWFLTVSALGVAAWGVRDVAASLALHAKAPPKPARAASGRTLLITGATGFLGQALTRRRLAAGDAIVVLTRDTKHATALFDGRVLAVSDLAMAPASLRIDGIVNLAGAGVANALWTRGRKRTLLRSRLNTTEALGALMARLDHMPDVFVNASAVGFYGDRGEKALTESAPAGDGFTAALCTQWERAAEAAGAQARRAVRLRFGLVFGRDGGAWPSLALPLLFKIAAQFGAGRQWMAWIHKEDALGLIDMALTDERLSGPVNATAPQETRHGDVIAALAETGAAWATLAAPAWALKLGLGEMAHLFLDSQRVLPRAAGAAGYVFKFPTIELAAADLLGRRQYTSGVAAIQPSP